MRYLTLILAFLCVVVAPAMAKDSPSFAYNDFAALPIQHDGRVKPIDSFARTHLKIFSGSDHLPGMGANEWLAETLFNPGAAAEQPLFYIARPEDFSLKVRKGRLYSFAEIAGSLKNRADTIAELAQKNEDEWSEGQRTLMELHAKTLLYTQLLRSFSATLPLAIVLPDSLRKAWKIAQTDAPLTLQSIAPYQARLQNALQKIIRAKGDDIEKYTADEKDIALFAWQVQMLNDGGADNIALRIVPPQWGGEEWLSPWALTQTGKNSPAAMDYLAHWKNMALAWQQGDETQWQNQTRAARETITAHTDSRLTLERLYNAAHPMGTAMLLYLGAFILMIGASFKRHETLLKTAFLSVVAGVVLHGAGIVSRVVILERAPVGTLYESILFVSLICVIGALLAERKLKDGTGILIAALAGGGLLFTAGAFTPDDTLQVLIAVLNTNFWLSTHVLCITIGYGWCLVAGVLAHLCLWQHARGAATDALMRIIKTAALAALLFTTVGTILGGIWADQSWGRFWGWDPKENGALLIVLWLIWLLHGRIAGQISRLPFLAGVCALLIVVALAWFGVNLLSTGLHSYGFIDGVATGLFAFCAAEAALIAALWYNAHKKGNA